MREAPRIGGEPARLPDETPVAAALRIAPRPSGGVLPLQGPPGAGKTHVGARMIRALVDSGFKVGITANSHKVIRNILNEVVKAADETGVALQCIQKVSEKEENQHRLQFTTDNAKLLAAVGTSCQVAAGTAWLWSRQDAFESVDVLFVDEAAQMSLANVLAISRAAKSIVLLGDPQQLDQPTQGSHPEGTDVSALDHILGDQQTLSAGRGLPEKYRSLERCDLVLNVLAGVETCPCSAHRRRFSGCSIMTVKGRSPRLPRSSAPCSVASYHSGVSWISSTAAR